MRLKSTLAQDAAPLGSYSSTSQQELILSLQEAIQARTPLAVAAQGTPKLTVFPHRLVFVDGELELIAEDCEGRFLRQFLVSEIGEARWLPRPYRPQYYSRDIERFLSAGREVVGNEIRLVLKAIGDAPVDLTPPFHYFASPYTAMNGDGQMIWAASVELSEPLFEWLAQIREDIQILDPPLLEQELDLYLEFVRQKK